MVFWLCVACSTTVLPGEENLRERSDICCVFFNKSKTLVLQRKREGEREGGGRGEWEGEGEGENIFPLKPLSLSKDTANRKKQLSKKNSGRRSFSTNFDLAGSDP